MSDFFSGAGAAVAPDLARAFKTSVFGAPLASAIPIGGLYRERFSDFERWQQAYAPTVKRRTPKKRKRKK